MTYDRSGRRVVAKASKPAAGGGAGSATPNAARLARGGSGGGGPALMSSGSGPRVDGVRGRSESPEARQDRLFRLRILPLTLVVALLVVGLKVEVLWDRQDEIRAVFTMGAPAVAADDPSDDQVTQLAQASETVITGPDETGRAASDERVDPFSLGKSQIELLQSLAERREELEERERALIQREGLLKAAEHRIETKIEELKTVKGEIEALIKTYDEQENEEINSLVSIYEKMKPKDAARIFNELDMEVLLAVFQQMKASRTAPVLAEMDPNRAKEVTTRIAERRQMPTIN